MREDERDHQRRPDERGRSRIEQVKKRISEHRCDACAKQVDGSSSDPIGERAADRDRHQGACRRDDDAVQDRPPIDSDLLRPIDEDEDGVDVK